MKTLAYNVIFVFGGVSLMSGLLLFMAVLGMLPVNQGIIMFTWKGSDSKVLMVPKDAIGMKIKVCKDTF